MPASVLYSCVPASYLPGYDPATPCLVSEGGAVVKNTKTRQDETDEQRLSRAVESVRQQRLGSFPSSQTKTRESAFLANNSV